MSAKRLAVIHWFPVEQYPPVTNLLNYFAADETWEVSSYSCTNDRRLPAYAHPRVTVHRGRFPSRALGLARRWLAYLAFPIVTLVRLLALRPDALLYFEPHSALPVALYKLVAVKCRVFVHYHEYHSPAEYLQPGMRLARISNWIEKRFLYKRAEWISHTNSDRIRLFLEDHPAMPENRLFVLPNYPPRSWHRPRELAWRHVSKGRLRLVYVGSLSLDDTFVKPLTFWVQEHSRDVSLDIFSYNLDESTAEFLSKSRSRQMRFHLGGVPYQDLPKVLTEFHVGLILYRGNTPNYVFNASNKLFEYLALGLDVWFPWQMLGVKPYATSETLPRVLETDFEKLDDLDLGLRRDRSGLEATAQSFACEDALRPLARLIEKPN